MKIKRKNKQNKNRIYMNRKIVDRRRQILLNSEYKKRKHIYSETISV